MRGSYLFDPVIWHLDPFGAPGLTRRNSPQAATLELELRVWDRNWLAEKRKNNVRLPRDINDVVPGRRLETYTFPCPYGVMHAHDAVAECVRADKLTRSSKLPKADLQMIEFRVDLGRLGQELASPPDVGVWLSVKGWPRGVDLSDLVADPEIADLGAIEDDRGRPGEIDLKWHERVPKNASGTYPDFPDATSDPTYALVTPETSRFAPPRIAPWVAPPKRLVQIWKYLITYDERHVVLVSRLTEHLLFAGGAGVTTYVNPGFERAFLANPTIRRLIAAGRIAAVRWNRFAQMPGWQVYDQVFFNAHAMLSHWGRNVILLMTDIDEVLALPDLPPAQELARRAREAPEATQTILEARKKLIDRARKHGEMDRKAKEIAAKAAKDKILEEQLARERNKARADEKSKKAVAKAKTGKALLEVFGASVDAPALSAFASHSSDASVDAPALSAFAAGVSDASAGAASPFGNSTFSSAPNASSVTASAAQRRSLLAQVGGAGSGNLFTITTAATQTAAGGVDYSTAEGAAALSTAAALARDRPATTTATPAHTHWNSRLPSVLAGLLVSNDFLASIEATPGIYSMSGRTSLYYAKQRGVPPPSPGDILPPPTPRQQRLSSVIGYGGCLHQWQRQLVSARYNDEAHASELRQPGCAQINGLATTSEGWAPDHTRRKTDSELFVGATSTAGIMNKFVASQASSQWIKPLVDPDAVPGVEVHSAGECFGGRTEPWGRPPPGGVGAQLPIQRRADGYWNLEELGIPQSLATKDLEPPPVRSKCRLIRGCERVPEECLQFKHLVNLHHARKGTQYTYLNNGWLWIYRNKDWKSAYPNQSQETASQN